MRRVYALIHDRADYKAITHRSAYALWRDHAQRKGQLMYENQEMYRHLNLRA